MDYNKKLILLNADKNHPEGTGYLVDDWPALHYSDFKIAQDMWALLDPRIANLEEHGIYNEKIRQLQNEGTTALRQAADFLEGKTYDQFTAAAAKSWALASRVSGVSTLLCTMMCDGSFSILIDDSLIALGL